MLLARYWPCFMTSQRYLLMELTYIRDYFRFETAKVREHSLVVPQSEC